MVLNEAVQALRQADELKQKVLKCNSKVSILTDRSLWLTQQQLQQIYQKVLVMDLDYALERKVEQDLWSVGFKQQIEALQAVAKDRKNPRRSEGQAMLAWLLQRAAGFYLCLLHQICTAFQLDLPFRRRASLLGEVRAWGSGARGPPARVPAPAAARYICEHCLVHLGDLARYRKQISIAHSFYRHALAVSTSSGQPYNQLALLESARGARLAALYYHVRSVAVSAPFPPARDNLARTLASAAASASNTYKMSMDEPLPVLPGVAEQARKTPLAPCPRPPARLSAPQFTADLIHLHHLLHTAERLDVASQLVTTLTSALTALVATEAFDSSTLIKMTCINIYCVHATSEDLQLSASSLAPSERRAAALAMELVAGALPALLLPACALPHAASLLHYCALPAVLVLLQWVRQAPALLREPSVRARLQLWPALARLLNKLADALQHFDGEQYSTMPLPEDEELHGFLPVNKAFAGLKFPNLSTWETYGNRIPEVIETDDPKTKPERWNNKNRSKLENGHFKESTDHKRNEIDGVEIENLDDYDSFLMEDTKKDTDLINSLRAYRLIQLGIWLADYQKENGPAHLLYSIKDGIATFTTNESLADDNPELVKALEELSLAKKQSDEEYAAESIADTEADMVVCEEPDNAEDADSNQKSEVPPPNFISEADFREKVRERRVGILKPQGSLERAREERLLALAQHDTAANPAEQEASKAIECHGETAIAADSSEESIQKDIGSIEEETLARRESKRRTNVAMQALMRKQEEGKQVKFITPATTPDSIGETIEILSKEHEKPKIIQPKAIKSLANLPLGRKTGGILSLKDKSAGYPHLVNTVTVEPSKNASKGETQNTEVSKKPESSGKHSQTHTPNSGPSNQNYAVQTSTAIKEPTTHQRNEYQNTNLPNSNWMDTQNHSSATNPIKDTARLGYFNQRVAYNAQNNMNTPAFNASNSGIRLPVVNPKEIDIRSAALQRQNSSRQDNVLMGPDNRLLGQHWQPTNDKQAFLNNLPPRFANQFRSKLGGPANTPDPDKYFSSNSNDSPDMSFSSDSNINTSRWDNFGNSNAMENLPQPPYSWWKSANPGNSFDSNFPSPNMNSQNYFMPQVNNSIMTNPYLNNPGLITGYNQQKFDYPQSADVSVSTQINSIAPNYLPNSSGMNQTSSFNSGIGNFNLYSNRNQSTSYDSTMYPQFNTNAFTYQPPSSKDVGPDNRKQLESNFESGMQNTNRFDGRKDPFGMENDTNTMNQRSSFGLGDYTPSRLNNDNQPKDLSDMGNTYSLFSGAQDTNTWGPAVATGTRTQQQSLWLGSGPSALERLLEQQKQMKQGPNE